MLFCRSSAQALFSCLGSFLISWRGAFGPPGSKTTVGLLFFPSPMLPHLRPTDGLRSRWNAGVFGAGGLPSAFSLPHPPTLFDVARYCS